MLALREHSEHKFGRGDSIGHLLYDLDARFSGSLPCVRGHIDTHDVVPGCRQVLGHGHPHRPQPDPCDLCHLDTSRPARNIYLTAYAHGRFTIGIESEVAATPSLRHNDRDSLHLEPASPLVSQRAQSALDHPIRKPPALQQPGDAPGARFLIHTCHPCRA